MVDLPKNRRILHVDMDAFFASVEQRDNPELRGKPVVVGGNPNSRGVVATASYEARKFGIHSAMPLAEAKRRCPEAIFVKANFTNYRQASAKIREIFLHYTPLVEPLSLDEAFLDVTASESLFGPAVQIAKEIKKRIHRELALTASVGAAPNKFLAKIVSDLHKPDGLVVVKPENVQQFLDPLPVNRIWGVGKKTAERLYSLNVKTVRDLRALEEDYLARAFGVSGRQLFHLARGIDNRPVEPEEEVKSIGRETTFEQDIGNLEELAATLLHLAEDVAYRLRKQGLKGRTIVLKIRYRDFTTVTRSKTLVKPTNLADDLYSYAYSLLTETRLKEPLRLIGVTAHNLVGEEEAQLSLFEDSNEKKEKLASTVDTVWEKFGSHSIVRARLLDNPPGERSRK